MTHLLCAQNNITDDVKRVLSLIQIVEKVIQDSITDNIFYSVQLKLIYLIVHSCRF